MNDKMRHTLGAVFLVLGLLALLAAVPAAGAETGPLDGRTFTVEMGKQGEAEGSQNTLTFRSGTFLSAVCVNYDFPQSLYQASRSGDAIVFEVTATSYTEGHMDWTGTVTGDRLEATAVWHRPGHDEPIELWIRGTERQ